MSAGLTTRRILDRHARQQQRAEQRSMQMLACAMVVALAAVVGTVGVLLVMATADKMAGLTVVSDALRAMRGVL